MPLYHWQNFQRWQKEVTRSFHEGNAANPVVWPPTKQNKTNKSHKKNHTGNFDTDSCFPLKMFQNAQKLGKRSLKEADEQFRLGKEALIKL